MIAVKERPIIFSASMIRSLLAGTKTQTRRHRYAMRKFSTAACFHRDYPPPHELTPVGKCWALTDWRKAKTGDRLWVREQFSFQHGQGLADRGAIWYWADGNPNDGDWTRPKPSIHMPRWASRITLEITGVRVERLNDISEADAIAEGCNPHSGLHGDDDVAVYLTSKSFDDAHGKIASVPMPIIRYAVLWDSINGPGSWASNPFVWRLSFRRIKP